MIGVGFLVDRYTALRKEQLAFLVRYLLAPVIVFNGVAVARLTLDSMVLPLFFFGLCSVLCLLFYYVGTFVWTDQTKNLLGFTGGDANVAIFGLPIARVLLGPPAVSLVVLAIVGFMLYENTLG
jgi:malate permease and related proteins